jgi:hypothetical protein
MQPNAALAAGWPVVMGLVLPKFSLVQLSTILAKLEPELHIWFSYWPNLNQNGSEPF